MVTFVTFILTILVDPLKDRDLAADSLPTLGRFIDYNLLVWAPRYQFVPQNFIYSVRSIKLAKRGRDHIAIGPCV